MYARTDDVLRARLGVDPARQLTYLDLKLMACLKGRFDILRQIHAEGYWIPLVSTMLDVLKGRSPPEIRQIYSAAAPCMTIEERNALLAELCKNDEYRLILLLDESREIRAADVEHKDACQMLNCACENGNLDLAVWLASRFEFRTQDVIEMELHHVCFKAHIHIMKWLTDRFRLGVAHVRARNILFNACMSGDIDFVRWVVGRFGLTARDARKDHHRLIWRMCTSGRVQVTAWIMEHFGLGRPGSSLSLVAVKRYAGIYVVPDEHYLRAVRWIERLQAIRLGSRGCHWLLRQAIKDEHINVIRWIVHRYDFTQKDLALPRWFDHRWLNEVQDTVWTEAGEVVVVQWPEETARGGC